MKNFKALVLLATIYFLGISCTGNSKSEETKVAETEDIQAGNSPIRKISVLYYNYDLESDKPTTCQSLKLSLPSFRSADYKGVLDATIDSPKVLTEIKTLLSTLHNDPARHNSDDIRMTATIEYENGAQDNLCIGGNTANTIYLNGAVQESNNRLIYLLKNNAGYYTWMIGSALTKMPELKDNSFMKEPFVSTAYYKKWQENRNAGR